MERPRLELTGVVLDSSDARELANFWARLLGWGRRDDEPEWVVLTNPSGGPGLSFQNEPRYRRPGWPTTDDQPPMMVHLDLRVDDLETAVVYAVETGATLAEVQPQDDVRVLLDPAGHPFCLYLER